MLNFEFYSPTRLVVGKGTADRIGEQIAPLAKKVLLHYGSDRVEKTGLLQRVKDSLTKSGVAFVTLGGVIPNPDVELVREGIALAQTVGAVMGSDYFGPAFWAPVSILQRPDGTQVRYPHLVWDRAKPGLMAVNSAGRRFVNESTSYHEFVLAMYRSNQTVPTVPAYLVCDSDFMERWGMGLALPGGRPREHLVKAGYPAQGMVGLHQLHPLLVHAVLFGGGYGARAVALAGRY